MVIGIASDHHGILKKEKIMMYLKSIGHEIIDYGTNDSVSVDYPIYAFKIGEAIQKKEIEIGILLCGTGIGMSIAANKINGVRCALIHTTKEAKLSRMHNNANCIALASDFTMFKIKDLLDVFINTKFTFIERHKNRVEMIDNK